MAQQIRDETLIQRLRDLADDLGDVPTTRDMDDHGPHPSSTYRKRFGSWNAALEAADLEVQRRYRSRTQLVEEIQAVADDLGRSPHITDLHAHSDLSPHRIYTHFDSWPDALDAAGLDEPSRKKIPDEELLYDLRRIAEDVGRVPRTIDVHRHGEYSVGSYYRRYDSWDEVVAAAGIDDVES